MVGTALRAVRNDAAVMLRLWYFAARSASAPYHSSHRLARCFQNAAFVVLCGALGERALPFVASVGEAFSKCCLLLEA